MQNIWHTCINVIQLSNLRKHLTVGQAPCLFFTQAGYLCNYRKIRESKTLFLNVMILTFALLYSRIKIIRKHILTAIFLLACFWLLSPLITTADHKYIIYFYNPETNINNFASLKKEFDVYLSSFGEYQLQPFSEREIFDKVISEKKDGIFLISSWHYKKLKETVPMEPALVAISKNKSTYRRILSVKKAINNPNLLKGTTIASSSSEDYTKSLLKKMLGKEDIVNSIKILTVPKDIDALMSVGFGVAAGALTTENSLDKLATINQKQYEMLRRLSVSEEILLPIAATPKTSDHSHSKLLRIMKEMGTVAEGKNKLNMLGLDTWKELDESEKRCLEK